MLKPNPTNYEGTVHGTFSISPTSSPYSLALIQHIGQDLMKLSPAQESLGPAVP